MTTDGTPLRILVVSMWPSEEAPERGTFVERQVEALRELGHHVQVAPLTDIRTGPVRTPLKYLRLSRAARRIARRFDPDVLHGHYLVPTGAVVRRVSQRLGTPYVVTAHGTDVRNAESNARIRAATIRVARDAGAVIAVSDALADDLHHIAPELPRSTVIDMGIDALRFTPMPDRGELAGRYGWRSDRRRVLAVGSLTTTKNHSMLVRAVAQIEDVELTIVGEGEERAPLRRLIDELGCGDRVRLPGRSAPVDLQGWLNSAEVVCLPSRSEGFGLVALEALACGTPVVVSRTAPVAALVTPDVGVVVDAGNVEALADGVRTALTIGAPLPGTRSLVEGRTTLDRAREVAEILRVAAH